MEGCGLNFCGEAFIKERVCIGVNRHGRKFD